MAFCVKILSITRCRRMSDSICGRWLSGMALCCPAMRLSSAMNASCTSLRRISRPLPVATTGSGKRPAADGSWAAAGRAGTVRQKAAAARIKGGLKNRVTIWEWRTGPVVQSLTTRMLLMSGSFWISSSSAGGGTLSRFKTVRACPPAASRLRLMLAMLTWCLPIRVPM